MANEVSFKIKLEGSEVKTVTADAEELGNVIDSVRLKSKNLNDELVNSAAISQVAGNAKEVLSQLNAVMSDLIASYTAQAEAETKLGVAMRNTMDATQADINAINDLIDAQERLGIVGGDVQTAAAQELATYLSMPEALKTIIPTLNDMIAQQLGLGASAESATQIATMLGKVMNGQTKALSRYGYEFSAAQEYILQFGDELERASVLCDVVGQSVGGMNEKFGQTDVGRQQQMANAIGKIKENLGSVAIVIQPYVTALNEIGSSVFAIRQLGVAVKGLKELHVVAAVHARMQAAAQKILAATGYSAAAGTTALKVATAALYTTITAGAFIAVEALIGLFSKLASKSKDAAEAIDETADAQKAYDDASMNVRLELAEETIKLENLIKKKKDASAVIKDLNARYGEIFGSHKTAAAWYDVLTQKSAAYAKQVGYEAQAKLFAAQKAEKEIQLANLQNQKKAASGPTPQLDLNIKQLEGEIYSLQGNLDMCIAKINEASDELGDMGNVSADVTKDEKKLADALTEYRDAVKHAVDENRIFNAGKDETKVTLTAMESGIKSLIGKYGAENTAVKQLIREYYDLARARIASSGELPVLDSSKLLPSGIKGPKQQLVRGNIDTRTVYDIALEKYKQLKQQLSETSSSVDRKAIEGVMASLREMYGIMDDGVRPSNGAIDALSGLSNVFRSLNGVIAENAASWASWGATLLQAIASVIPSIVTLTAAHRAKTSAAMGDAIAEGSASVAGVPIVGPGMAVAAAASIAATLIATLASIPKLAAGGLAYGPIIGLMGEYAGASNNPEVIAPLDKLKSYFGGATGNLAGKVVFEIDGRKLRGILNKVDRINGRTR